MRQIVQSSVLAVLFIGQVAAADQIVTLHSRGDTAVFDSGPDGGFTSFTLDGVNQLDFLGYFFRIGSDGGEASIQSLNDVEFTNAIGEPLGPSDVTSTINVFYSDPNLPFRVRWLQAIAGTGFFSTGAFSDSVIVTNEGTADLDLHLFQFVDLDLGDSSIDASISLERTPTRSFINGEQEAAEDSALEAYLSPSGNSEGNGFTFVTPTHFTVGLADQILSDLEDNQPTALSDFGGPITNGDLAYAFQWDILLPPGESRAVGTHLSINVPEPSSISVLLILFCILVKGKRDAL